MWNLLHPISALQTSPQAVSIPQSVPLAVPIHEAIRWQRENSATNDSSSADNTGLADSAAEGEATDVDVASDAEEDIAHTVTATEGDSAIAEPIGWPQDQSEAAFYTELDHVFNEPALTQILHQAYEVCLLLVYALFCETYRLLS